MTAIEDPSALEVPERVIHVPTSVSSEAQAYLARGRLPAPAYPPLVDGDAWRTMIAATDKMVLERFHAPGRTPPPGFVVDDASLDGVRVYLVTPPDVERDHRVYLDIHGGAWIIGGGDLCRAAGVMMSTKLSVRVCSVDYRMPPDHPYPAAVDDCLTVYRALLRDHRSEDIVIGGGSAGGNIAAALILRARDEGLPLPAAAVLLTPALDLSHGGDTWRTNEGVDTVLSGKDPSASMLYAGGHDLKEPYLSPLFGDLAKGFPPTLLASGTRDVLLSDTVRMHCALRGVGVEAELHVLEGAPHGFFGGTAPEDAALDQEVRRFINVHCPPK